MASKVQDHTSVWQEGRGVENGADQAGAVGRLWGGVRVAVDISALSMAMVASFTLCKSLLCWRACSEMNAQLG